VDTKVTVAGVQLNNNTALTTKNEEYNSLRNGETVAGVELNNNTENAKQSER
jgi:hypothetical protein